MTEFEEIVGGRAAAQPILPFIHSTDLHHFKQIMDEGQLRPTPCPVFQRDLLYLYYGKPTYRTRTGADPSSLLGYLPVCLVLSADVRAECFRFFPFDSGAFGLYKKSMYYKLTVGDFALASGDSDTPAKLVDLFFGTNDDYCHGTTRPQTNDRLSVHLDCISALFSVRGEAPFDDRSQTFEGHCDSPLELRSSLLAVVIPATLKDQPTFQRFAFGIPGLATLTYNFFPLQRPEERYGALRDKCHDYMRAQRWVQT